MPAVQLIADSTADLDAGWARDHDVTVVPLRVIIGEEEFLDSVDIDPATLYSRMRGGDVPRTSQPTPAEFEAVFRRLGASGTPIVCTTISAEMSGTYSSATQARAALPDADIRVVDTRTCAMAHHALVREAMAVRDAGGDADAVVERLKTVMAKQRLVFTVGSLEYLRRGGRIGGASALLGSVLDIKPLIEVRNGRVEPIGRVRTWQKALGALAEEVKRSSEGWGSKAVITVAHADRLEDGRALVETLRPFAAGEPELIEVGPVIGCHGGPGAVGAAFHPAG